MITRTKVQGCKKQSKELVIDIDTVYVHSNTRKLEFKETDPMYGTELYEYDEIEYSLEEWNNKITNPYGVPDVKVVNIIDDFTINLMESGAL